MHQRYRKFSIVGAAVLTATGLTVMAAPAIAAPYCDTATKASFARAQLFAETHCKGGSMIIKSTDANGDRSNFAQFRNYDARTYHFDNTRSSLAVAAGNCIRVFDGANYTSRLTTERPRCGFALPPEKTTARATVAWNAPTPPPPPAPTPTPAPAPASGSFPKDVTSAPDKARYDDAGPWKSCTRGFTPGAKRLQAWIRANWGPATIQGFNCRRNTADRSKTSIHGVGRASDWFRNARNKRQAAQVASFIRRMSANRAAMARAMGVQYWIWNRQQYSVRGTTVVRRRYTGPNPHTDHVHIEQNLAGSRLQTSYWRRAGG
jgi:hypothetical protein